MGNIFGGGSGEAKRQAQIQRESQQVANDRQLAQLNKADERTVLSRSRPRGRRLFADAARSDLPSNLA